MRTEWVVLADDCHARIFARVGGEGWQDIRDITRANGTVSNGRELRLPAAMRKLHDGGTARRLEDDFPARVARELRAARKRGDFDALVLVAPAEILEPLQAALDSATRRKLIATAAENLMSLPLREARQQLARRF